MSATKRKLPPQRTASKTILTAFRFNPAELNEIDQRAEALQMTRTQYVTDAALDRLGDVISPVESHLNAMERRLARLEDFAFGG